MGLVDTGATLTVANKWLLDFLGLNMTDLKPVENVLQGVTGAKIKAIGKWDNIQFLTTFDSRYGHIIPK